MTRTDVYVAAGIAVISGLAGCGRGAVGDEYQCRVTTVTDEVSGETLPDAYHPEFVFTVAEESDIYVAGDIPAVTGKSRFDHPAFIVVSKLDGNFEGMQIQRGKQSTLNSGFCKPQER